MDDRLEALQLLAGETAGRVPAELTARALELGQRANRRLRLGEQTAVAVAGATGSGKSSLTNVLSGTNVAQVGSRRPTTGEPLAITFGPANSALLDWLEVRRRYETPPPRPGMGPVILLDLPDHDSTESSHREQVDRLVPVVDQFVWVLDPQKYADLAVHRDYLGPLAPHREVIAVVLNQVDRLQPHEVGECLHHLEQLLASDGLPGVPLFATSTVTGAGIDDLRGYLADVAARKSAARSRLATDITVLVEEFDAECPEPAPELPRAELQAALEAAAGVPAAVAAAAKSTRYHGGLATDWPLLGRWRRVRPDPARQLARGASRGRSAVTEAQLSQALRAVADGAGAGLGPGWQQAITSALQRGRDGLRVALDRAVSTSITASVDSRIFRGVRATQWLLIAAAGIGLGWLLINLVLTTLALPPVLGEVPVWLLLLVLVVAVAVTVGTRLVVGWRAHGAARRAQEELSRAVGEVGHEYVLEPVAVELDRLKQARQLVRRILR